MIGLLIAAILTEIAAALLIIFTVRRCYEKMSGWYWNGSGPINPRRDDSPHG